MYDFPADTSVILVTMPRDTTAVPFAGAMIFTNGVLEYPEPPFVTFTCVIEPPETTAVAIAPEPDESVIRT